MWFMNVYSCVKVIFIFFSNYFVSFNFIALYIIGYNVNFTIPKALFFEFWNWNKMVNMFLKYVQTIAH